jgi:lipopolysaccharide transport system ATP-binding protein
VTAHPVRHALAVTGVSKLYKLYDSPRARLQALLTGRETHRPHWALNDVSFVLERGQCLGVIGDNGAGKSTLLKLVAGTLQPTAGEIVRGGGGRVTAILELGAGFHPEFTGRENLRFAGALIGIPEAEVARREAQIIGFAELEESIDRPVKTYSSGMTVRLAFALATAIEPDILIIDEALAVGDQHFQKKCVERIDAFRRSGCTILFCSHSQYHVRQLCDAALWLDGGRTRLLGPTEMVLAGYEAHVRTLDAQRSAPAPSARPGADTRAVLDPGRRAAITHVTIGPLGAGDPPLLAGRDLTVSIRAAVAGEERPNFGVMIEQARGVGITVVATHVDGAAATRGDDGSWTATVTFPDLPLHSGEYVISAYLADSLGMVIYDEWLQHARFVYASAARLPGLVSLKHHWS